MAKAAKKGGTGRRKAKAKAKATSKKPAASRSRKKAAAKKVTEPKDKCFVISPFGGWHDEYYTEVFCPAIKAAGLASCRADDLFRSSNIVHDIWHLVLSARVLLADLTGKNPNVFYELGLAHAARKPVLLLTQSMEDVPFDLRSLRVINYDVEDPHWGQVLRDGIKQGLKETLESPERSVLPTFLLEEPGDQPQVSEDEARFIDLQQQVNSLRSELRATERGGSGEPQIRALEARALISEYLEAGMPRSVIIRRVTERGAPRGWVEEQIQRQKKEGKGSQAISGR